MKLAEALCIRSDIQKRNEQLKARLCANALVQEGDEPAEDPKVLLKELDHNMKELEDLISRINLTNASVKKDGITLTEMLAKRDVLLSKLVIMREFHLKASQKIERYSSKEIRITSTIEVKQLRKDIDACEKQLRELDIKIQECNWSVELI